jgi:hypothetical protein
MLNTLARLQHYFLRGKRRLAIACDCMRGPHFRWVAPGHFYSPLPDMREVERRNDYIYPTNPSEPAGIDLQREGQLELMHQLLGYRTELPLDRARNKGARYYRPNGSFLFQDAFTLAAMIKHLKPARLVEVGCGMSSCVTLDTCEALQLNTQLTFIEPYPKYLLGLLRPEDQKRFTLKSQFIQDVPIEVFTELEAGDILFIDTSHVSKVGSDVNHIFFQILPRIKSGVYIHFHDIWYPFEYPKDWLHRGMFWNEAYMLRALLSLNPAFRIILFNNYLLHTMAECIKSDLPLCFEEPGASIWLQRV